MEFREKVIEVNNNFTAESMFSDHYEEREKGKIASELSEAEFFLYQQNLYSTKFDDVLEYIKGRGFK